MLLLENLGAVETLPTQNPEIHSAKSHSRNVWGGFAARTSSFPLVPDRGSTVFRAASGWRPSGSVPPKTACG